MFTEETKCASDDMAIGVKRTGRELRSISAQASAVMGVALSCSLFQLC